MFNLNVMGFKTSSQTEAHRENRIPSLGIRISITHCVYIKFSVAIMRGYFVPGISLSCIEHTDRIISNGDPYRHLALTKRFQIDESQDSFEMLQ